MSIKLQLDQDIKTAMLAGDKVLVTVLRGIKSAILYAEVSAGSRDDGLPEDEIQKVLAKESKKRQESAEMYAKAGATDREQAELAEKTIIDAYLPKQLSDDELVDVVDSVIVDQGPVTSQTMGKIIGFVKEKTAGQADGGRIATIVRSKMEQS